MLLLSGLEDLIEIDSLLIIGGLLKLTLCLLSILLVNLLLNPLFLLLLLQLHSLFLHYIILVESKLTKIFSVKAAQARHVRLCGDATVQVRVVACEIHIVSLL